MKHIALGIGTVLVLAIAVLLVAPSFIDWTKYRDTFESQLANRTGRTVTIDGDVSLALLPRPAFQVDGVRIANLPEATDPDFARASRVAVNLAFGPLLSGRLQFTSIEIIEPVINAEVLENGSVTWAFVPVDSGSQSTSNVSSDGAAFDLGINVLRVVEGTVHYRDAISGTEQNITGLSVELTAESTAGPFDIAGNATVFGMPWQIEASIGTLRRNRPSALVVVLTNADAALRADLSGSLTLGEQGPVISGRLRVSGDNTGETLSRIGLIGSDQLLPLELRQTYHIESRFKFENASFQSDSINIKLGSTTAQGTGLYSWQDAPQFSLQLTVSRLDLEAWRLSGLEHPIRFAATRSLFGFSPARAQLVENSFILPAGVEGTIDFRINLVEWRGQVMRNARLNASLAKAELTLTDTGLDLPGNTFLQISGFVRSESGLPFFDLTTKASSRDLRSMLDWLGVAPPPGLVPPSQLNSLSVASRLSGIPTRIVFEDLDIVLDTTRLSGTAIVELGTPLKTTVDLSVLNLDLDSYLPALRNQFEAFGADLENRDIEPEPTKEDGDNRVENPLAVLDANVTLSVGALTVGGNIVRGILVDASMENGILNIKDASFEDFAGARLAVSGRVHDITTTPRADDVHLSISTDNFARFDRAVDMDLPRLGIFEGPIALEGDLSGSVEDATIDLAASFGDLSVNASGSITNAATIPVFNLRLSLAHERYRQMMRSLGVPLSDSADAVGPVQIQARIAGTPTSIQIDGFQAQAGENALSGTVEYHDINGRSQVTGSIAMACVDFEKLFPPDATEQLARSSRRRGSSGGNAISGRWATDPIDLSDYAHLEVSLSVTADRLRVRGFEIDHLNAPVTLSSGILSVTGWQGDLYGGPANGDLTLVMGPPIEVQSRLEVVDAAIDRIGGSLVGTTQASGKATLRGEFAARGLSQRDLVMSLAAQGTFAATGIDASTAGRGVAFTAVLAPIKALSQLGGVFSGGVTQGLAEMEADFRGEQGIITLSNATLKSNVYSGAFAGSIDLPRWWIDVEGLVRLEVNLITQLFGNRLQMPSLIPLTIRGPLDLPNVNMSTGGGTTDTQPQDPASPGPMAPP